MCAFCRNVFADFLIAVSCRLNITPEARYLYQSVTYVCSFMAVSSKIKVGLGFRK